MAGSFQDDPGPNPRPCNFRLLGPKAGLRPPLATGADRLERTEPLARRMTPADGFTRRDPVIAGGWPGSHGFDG